MRSARIVPVLSASAVVLAACGGIPTSGPPESVDKVAAEDSRPVVGSEAQPPVAGATAEELVDGFLEAMQSYERGADRRYGTASEYLTPAVAEEWAPLSAITIYEARPDVAVDGDVAVVTFPVEATYDRSSGYVRKPSGTEESYEFALEEIDGELRIANPPSGLVLSEFAFENSFQGHNLYFFDPYLQELVPDPVYVPRGGGDEATLLVQHLLAGPSEWLEPAVETAFPDRTTLEPSSVPVSGGVAEIRLSAEAANTPDGSQTSPDDRSRMAQQLAWTLGQVPGVDQLTASADTVQLTEAAVISAVDAKGDGAGEGRSTLFAIADAGVVRIDDDAHVPVDGPLGTADYADAADLAVDNSAGRAAVVDADGRLVWAELDNAAEPQVVAAGGALVAPSWDNNGLLWVVDQGTEPTSSEAADTEAGIVVIDPDSGEERRIGVDGERIERCSPAPDGTRLACVIDDEVWVGLVLRDPDDPMAVEIAGLRPARFQGLTDPVADVSWRSAHDLAILTGVGDENGDDARLAVYVAALDTLTATVHGSRLDGQADSIAVTHGGSSVAIGTPDDGVLVLTETRRWAPVPDVSSPAYAR